MQVCRRTKLDGQFYKLTPEELAEFHHRFVNPNTARAIVGGCLWHNALNILGLFVEKVAKRNPRKT